MGECQRSQGLERAVVRSGSEMSQHGPAALQIQTYSGGNVGHSHAVAEVQRGVHHAVAAEDAGPGLVSAHREPLAQHGARGIRHVCVRREPASVLAGAAEHQGLPHERGRSGSESHRRRSDERAGVGDHGGKSLPHEPCVRAELDVRVPLRLAAPVAAVDHEAADVDEAERASVADPDVDLHAVARHEHRPPGDQCHLDRPVVTAHEARDHQLAVQNARDGVAAWRHLDDRRPHEGECSAWS